MKAYRLEVLVLGFENMSMGDVIREVGNCRHISPRVLSSKEAEIGEWHDDHPLNKFSETAECIKRLEWTDAPPSQK